MARREKITFPLLVQVAMRAHEARLGGSLLPVAFAVMRRETDGAILFVRSASDADDWAFPHADIDPGDPASTPLIRGLNQKLGLGPESYSLDWYLGEADVPHASARASDPADTDGERCFFFALTCQRPDVIVLAPSAFAAFRWADERDAASVLATTHSEKREALLDMLRRLTV